jgi:hypothetical protein
MKIIYIITAYKLPDQLVRLVKKLNTDDTSFFIHVDKKTDDETYNRMVSPLSDYANVTFLKRHICYWGQLGHVKAKLEGIKEIITRNIQYDYINLISGQDYPIKSNLHIQKVLQRSEGKSYLNYFTYPDPLAEKWEERFAYWNFYWLRWHFIFPKADIFEHPCANQLWNGLVKGIPLRRKIPGGLQPFYGGGYWCLSKESVEYVFEFLQQHKDYERFFNYVYIPDEIFFQTILLNSIFKDRIVNDDLRFIEFSEYKGHPAILGKNDFERILKTDNLFARKFDTTIDSDVLDMIDSITT